MVVFKGSFRIIRLNLSLRKKLETTHLCLVTQLEQALQQLQFHLYCYQNISAFCMINLTNSILVLLDLTLARTLCLVNIFNWEIMATVKGVQLTETLDCVVLKTSYIFLEVEKNRPKKNCQWHWKNLDVKI